MAKGYFKQDDKTKESFFEEGGKRWFKSGDIGKLDTSMVYRSLGFKI